MNQPSLFPDNRYTPPAARATDPATSQQAAEAIAPKRGTAAAMMLAAIRMANRMATEPTAQEAAAACVANHGGIAETYRKRIKDIEPHLIRTGSRRCEITGQQATTFRVRPCH